MSFPSYQQFLEQQVERVIARHKLQGCRVGPVSDAYRLVVLDGVETAVTLQLVFQRQVRAVFDDAGRPVEAFCWDPGKPESDPEVARFLACLQQRLQQHTGYPPAK